VLSVAILLLVATSAGAQTADELIAKNIAAKGGMEKLKAVQSFRQTSDITVQGMAAKLTIYSKRPNLTRQEIVVGPETIVSAFDGQTPWMVNPMSGSTQATVITGPQADMIRNDASFDGPLVDYKARGTTVELVGAEDVDGTAVHHLKVTGADGLVKHIYLDASTSLEMKVTTETPEGLVEQRFTDYRDVGGLKVPYSITVLTGGAVTAQIKLLTVDLNAEIDDALFRIPR
jgi:outer membrane lipoprotein-sorting protein